MKIFLLILAGICATALSIPSVKEGEHWVVTDKGWLEKQRHILQLTYRINQRDHRHAEYENIGKTYSIQEHADSYTKPEVVKKFMTYWKYDRLPRHVIFSVMEKEHREQAIALFKLFYYAKDWDTFYKTAVWARQNVNQGMFVYTFNLALIHRPDTRNFMLPPIYEVKPHFFYPSEVIHKAEILKQAYQQASHDKTYHTIESNYSGWYLNLHPEQSLSYFQEDVGVNAFCYYFNLYYPSWMDADEFGWKDSRRGELFLYVLQQVYAHYYQERISNKFGDVQYLDWDTPVETSYEPSLVYSNGLEFPSRPKFANLHEYFYNYKQKWSSNVYGYSHTFVKDFDRRINDAIDSGVAFTKDGKMLHLYSEEGLNILGNIIQANANSPNIEYYGALMQFARHLLGYSMQSLDHHRLVPSALEHFETSMRDPVVYQLLKKVLLKIERYMSHVPPYTEKDLVTPGVKVTDMQVDALTTYDDHFYSDLSNAVWYHPDEKYDFRVRVRQTRLNSKPFNVKIHVHSEKNQKVSVKLFMTPKDDEWGRPFNLSESRMYAVEMDHWMWELKTGDNEITRHSNEFKWFVDDRQSQTQLYESVVNAIDNNQPFQLDGRQNYFYWPRRFMLPKGSPEGVPHRFIVVVYPWEHQDNHVMDPRTFVPPGTSQIFLDSKPLKYPLDRPIKFNKMWHQIPNIYFHDEMIYHKDLQNINSPHH